MNKIIIQQNMEYKELESLGVCNWPIWSKEESEFP